jgi:subtilase family serine protease
MRFRYRLLALAVAPLPIVATAFGGTAQAAPNPLVALSDNVNSAVAHSSRIGDLPAGQQLSVAVALKLRNTGQLDRFLADVGNPRSAAYGHYLTPQQFDAAYGPTKAETEQVVSFLRGKGLHVTDSSGQVVDATGTSAQLDSAFSTTLGVYTDSTEHRQYFANDRAPLVPASIAGVVQGVVGLDNHTVKHHSATPAAAPAAAPTGLGPSSLRSIYNTAPIGADGTGQSVALWEFDGYKQSDIAAYDQNYALGSTAPTTVPVDGQNYDSSPGDGQAEVSLDIEIVQAMAPKASTLVYEAPNTDQGEIDMAKAIVTDNKVQVTSISWGSCEPDTTASTMTSTDNQLKQGAAQGISFFSASGDSGSKDCTRSSSGAGVVAVDFPASSPNVTGVGGTTLTTGSNSTYGSETVWNNSHGATGGGVSKQFPAPSWQTGSNGKRTVPDVASDGDPVTGYAVYSGGAWGQYGGTSCAAPMWAGWAALYNQKAKAKLGAANQALYQVGNGTSYGSAFHDVTSGSNGDFSAKTGYDDTTGWGSYNGGGLFTALNGSTTTPGNTVTVTNPGDQTTALNGKANVQIKATDSSSTAKLTYTASGLPAGLSISSSTGLVSGTATTQATSNVTVTVTDDTQAAGTATFKWTVGTPPTGTVTVKNPGTQVAFKGYPLFQTVQLSATASDGGALTYSATGLPAGVSVSSSGLITGTPTASGTFSVTATATEAGGAKGAATFSFQVYGF